MRMNELCDGPEDYPQLGSSEIDWRAIELRRLKEKYKDWDNVLDKIIADVVAREEK